MLTVQPNAPTYTGEVTVMLGGAARTVRFGINTLRDYSAFTGTVAGSLARNLATDMTNTMVNLMYCAVKRYTPAAELPEGFAIDHVAEWIDEMSPEEAARLAEAVLRTLRTGNPLTAALVTRLTPPTTDPSAGTDGTTSSTSPSAS